MFEGGGTANCYNRWSATYSAPNPQPWKHFNLARVWYIHGQEREQISLLLFFCTLSEGACKQTAVCYNTIAIFSDVYSYRFLKSSLDLPCV